MTKPLLLLLFSIACLSFSCAQSAGGTLKGKVTAEGVPLELATVALLKTAFAVSTDKFGEFNLENIPPGKYQLRISFVGYENFQEEVTIRSNATTDIFADLIPLTSRLKEIVVTGTLKEVKKLESVTPVDVYTAKYFQRNPVTNVFDAVYQLNGIFADIDNGVSNTTDVQINGLEGNYTLFLIDGVPAMNGLAGIYALTALPLSMIDKIEILKGASSTLYGSEAIAGVINIKTKDPGKTPRVAANVALTSMLEA
ncbi:MAG: TonB-dependent receptor, partial [Bacteroidota bacterium]